MKIVTGRTGKPHVTSEDDRILQNAIWGKSGILSDNGSGLIDSNTFRVMPINILFQGCHARILPGEYEDITIENGVAGQKRIDLIVARYSMSDEGIESMELKVIKGTPVTSGVPTVPPYNSGDINNGAAIAEMPLWTIPVNDMSVCTPALQCETLLSIKDQSTMNGIYSSIDTLGEELSRMNTEMSAAIQDNSAAIQENSEQLSESIQSVKKTAEAGKVITGSSRLTFSFESGVGTDTQTFSIPQGTDGIFVVLKSVSPNIIYRGYNYTIKDNACTLTVVYDIKSGTSGSIVVVAICTGSAAAIV